MTSELSFLIELLLKHKLPVATKDLVAERIKEVESQLSAFRPSMPHAPKPMVVGGSVQSPSTLAAMERHALAGEMMVANPMPLNDAPVAVVAQSLAAEAAMQSRAVAMAGRKIHDPVTGRPRKF